MFTNILLPQTIKVLNTLKTIQRIQTFYLSGGTALALQIGHRESEDLDFFCLEKFNPVLLQKDLHDVGKLSAVELAEGTLNAFIDTVKVQFLYYPYTLLEQPISWEGIKLSSLIDIACTKMITVSMRGSKKDFIDLYFLLKTYTVPVLLQRVKQKYQNVEYNNQHLLKSLVYFDDAELQPMPRMHETVSWEEIKNSITQTVKSTSPF